MSFNFTQLNFCYIARHHSRQVSLPPSPRISGAPVLSPLPPSGMTHPGRAAPSHYSDCLRINLEDNYECFQQGKSGDPKNIEGVPERELHREEEVERILCFGIMR